MHIKLTTHANLTGKGPKKPGWSGEHDDDESKALIGIGYAKEVKEPVKEKPVKEDKDKGNAPENKGR